MKKLLTLLFLFNLIVAGTALHAQGLLGHRYFGIEGGYVRVSNGATFDGFGAGAGINLPILQEGIGLDFSTNFGLTRLSENSVDIDSHSVLGGLRAFMDPEGNVKPFVGVAFGWSESKVSAPGFQSETVDSFFTSYALGVELSANQFGIRPSIGYQWFTDDDFEDVWSIGASANYWIDENWSLTASAFYSDTDNDVDGYSILGGILFAF